MLGGGKEKEQAKEQAPTDAAVRGPPARRSGRAGNLTSDLCAEVDQEAEQEFEYQRLLMKAMQSSIENVVKCCEDLNSCLQAALNGEFEARRALRRKHLRFIRARRAAEEALGPVGQRIVNGHIDTSCAWLPQEPCALFRSAGVFRRDCELWSWTKQVQGRSCCCSSR